MPRPVAWLYQFARRGFRRGVDFYFLDIQVTGLDNVPANGPVLLACNHPNSIMDTFVLGSQIDRPIHFLARSGLFGNPLVGAMLRATGAIPVYRRRDGPAKAGGNASAFRAAFDVLATGGIIGIFPEGHNAPVRHVRDIKTGVARIALGAEREHADLGVQIVPVGLNYEERDQFLTRVLVRFGEPIAAAEFAEDDERRAARRLTDRIQESMRTQAVHAHDEEHTQLLHAIDALVGAELQEKFIGKVDVRSIDERLISRAAGRGDEHHDLEGRFRVRQWIADAIAHYEVQEPESVERLRRGIDRYTTHLKQLRVRADFADKAPRSLSTRRETAKLTTYAILIAPIALWGLLHNFIPFRLARRFAIAAPEEAIRAVRALVGGFAIFATTYAVYGASVYAGSQSWVATALYLGFLPVCGVWFLRYRQRLGVYRGRILLRALFLTRRKLFRSLLLEREHLLVLIGALEQQYRKLRLDASSEEE